MLQLYLSILCICVYIHIHIYIHTDTHTSSCAAAMHNRHFLGHNQSLSLQKRLAWLLIITSRRKVLVLGLVTKSILKICIWQQLGVLGRASPSEQEQGAHVTAIQKMNYISK